MRIPFPALALLLVLGSCQSAPPPVPAAEPAAPAPAPVLPPAPPAPDRIEVSREGFSPRAQAPAHTLAFTLRWGDPGRITGWEVRVVSDGGTVVRRFQGTDPRDSLTWDGTADTGQLAPQGTYRAVLAAYGADGTLEDRDETIPFLLDLDPPRGTITVSPLPFAGGTQALTIDVQVTSGAAPWTLWRLGVLHPDGRRFRDFLSEEHRGGPIVWDGKARNNAALEAGVTYRLEAEVFDVWGNRGLITADLPVEAPAPVEAPEPVPEPATLSVTLDGSLLAQWPIFFAPYAASLEAASPEHRQSNQEAMDRLAALLADHPATEVTVVGHANKVFYDDPDRGAREQEQTLVPLSLARAEAVRQALGSRGLDPAALGVRGVGAENPVVPFSDAANRWKNRRVVVELTGS